MSNGEKQIAAWTGTFGDAYIERNEATPERVQQRVQAFSRIFAHLLGAPPASILEVGANIGLNLRALKQVTAAELHAVEPNQRARAGLLEDGVLDDRHVRSGDLRALPFEDGSVDLVFTSCVLIHVPEDALPQAYREIHRVARRHILAIEYFSPTPVTVRYRGEDDLLFKRDYGGLWLDWFPRLELVADGFFWKRTTGLDDVNWWLFRK